MADRGHSAREGRETNHSIDKKVRNHEKNIFHSVCPDRSVRAVLVPTVAAAVRRPEGTGRQHRQGLSPVVSQHMDKV